MSTQITIRLDDALAADATAEATAGGTDLSKWVRAAIEREVRRARALRARAEEDALPLRDPADDETLFRARQARAVAAFDEFVPPAGR